MPRVLVLPAVVSALVLAAPAAALAADPIPGATYEGTTDTGSPFSLKVGPDGASVTEIVTSAPLTCVGPEGGVEIFAIVSKAPIPIAGGAINGKDESPTPRLDAVTGTFTSPNEVSGKIQAAHSKFKIGEGVTSCMREVAFTAKTSATAPAPAGGAAPAGVPAAGAPAQGAPVLTGLAAQGGKLAAALRKGLTVSGALSSAGKVTATARVSAKDARRYGVKRTIARRSGNVAGGPFALVLKPSAATARKLKRARSLKVVLEVAAGGAPVTRTITLKR